MSYFEKMLDKSLECGSEEDWLYAIKMEYCDDSEGMDEKEYFHSYFAMYYPNPNDLEHLSAEELAEFEEVAYKRYSESNCF